ncbi:hypothetical protein PT015_24085 [Candidatus Mycobacterium wuenschmannii]|uniref:Integral membrane protein n=1 Tax=Candidatus Mycobacterium wuenschmannii TaxID=3027808 RepID=A0ABY8W0A7_9MYCO|nr:hypothetical protein [Candidatus Mycobacterium wuenschmannii]WIM87863.1 hypothetical protein PT015_24085 [Candidatus Mycobacterium wuenschmannii]
MISRPPNSVRGAGAIVAAQGVAGLVAAVVLLVRAIGGAGQRGNNVFGTAGWFAFAGGAVLAAGWALYSGRRWGRGLAVFAELLLLGVAYYLSTGSHRPAIGAPVAAVSLAVLALLFSPPALRWVSGDDYDGPASSDSADPETR